jgi:site-specific recombinase XerD
MKLNEMNDREMNIFKNLQQQKDSIMKNGHEGSIGTRRRYNDALDLFCKIMAIEFSKQNIRKISNHHIERVVEVLQESGYSKSTVTNTMSAIRYFYRKAIGTRFIIKNNRDLGVDARGKEDRIGPNRAMTDKEFDQLTDIAFNHGRMDIVLALDLGKTFGLRIHEVYKMSASIVKEALKTGKLRTVGKGGLIRYQPLDNNKKRSLLEVVLEQKIKSNDKIFVHNHDTHLKIKEIQKFIADNRKEVQEKGRYQVTFHSLRHNYAQSRYQELLNSGMSETESKYTLIREIGHSRLSVCDIYLKQI